MSELKAYRPRELVMQGRHNEPIYLKSEADAEIAELKNKINEVRTELELWRDGSIISELHQKELDGKRHSDYKRCLAMARWCDEAYHRECGLNPEEMTDKEFYKQQIEFWPRWSSRWLAIAEKFKETK